MKKRQFLLLIIIILIISQSLGGDILPFKNPNFPIEARINNLISRLTLEEKVSLMLYNSPAIQRLEIPEYNWWNEALHGVARAGKATVFPQAIGLAASFETQMIYRIAVAIFGAS